MLTSERTSRSWVSRQVTELEPRGARTRGGLVSPGRTGCCLPTGRVVTSLPTDAKAPSRRRPRPPAPARTPSWDALGGPGKRGPPRLPAPPSAPPPLSSSSWGPRLARGPGVRAAARAEAARARALGVPQRTRHRGRRRRRGPHTPASPLPALPAAARVDFTLSTPSSARPQNRLGLNVSPPRPLPAGTAPGRPSGHPRSRRSSRSASLRCPGARAPFPSRGLCGKRLPLPRVASLPFCSLGSPPSSSVSRNFSGSRTCARGQRSRTRHRLQQREPEAS